MTSPLVSLHRTQDFFVLSVASLREAAVFALRTADVFGKAAVARRIVAAWEAGEISEVVGEPETDAQVVVPSAPSRPEKRTSGFLVLGRGATEPTIHGIAHAESYAIDLFWDCIARYTGYNMPREFYDQLVFIAGQEATHFLAWATRLEELRCPYGSLQVHEGLWRSAQETSSCLLSRLAVINMLHEARGLDTFPLSLDKFVRNRDGQSEAILRRNCEEEVGHVACGFRWFNFLCLREGREPIPTFHRIVREHHPGPIKGPFNIEARRRAGLTEEWYMPLCQ